MTPKPNQSESPASSFDAFISYSQVDRKFATKLETALEKVRLAGLVGARANGRLRIFRDESDMTGTVYHDSIAKFLKSSGKLIVICSPNAAKSAFVNDEIIRFREHHDVNDIIPVLFRGTPNNEANPGDPDQAFPPALCDIAELPLAVPYRDFEPGSHKIHKGTHKSSWFSLLARLFDVSREEVEKRDQKLRRQQLTIAFGLMSLVIAALAFLALYAFQQRDLATEALLRSQDRLYAKVGGELIDNDPSTASLLLGQVRELQPTDFRKMLSLLGKPMDQYILSVPGEKATEAILTSNSLHVLAKYDTGSIRVFTVPDTRMIAEIKAAWGEVKKPQHIYDIPETPQWDVLPTEDGHSFVVVKSGSDGLILESFDMTGKLLTHRTYLPASGGPGLTYAGAEPLAITVDLHPLRQGRGFLLESFTRFESQHRFGFYSFACRDLTIWSWDLKNLINLPFNPSFIADSADGSYFEGGCGPLEEIAIPPAYRFKEVRPAAPIVDSMGRYIAVPLAKRTEQNDVMPSISLWSTDGSSEPVKINGYMDQFSPDSKSLLTRSSAGHQLWRTSDGNLLADIDAHEVRFERNGQEIVASPSESGAGRVAIYAPETADPQGKWVERSTWVSDWKAKHEKRKPHDVALRTHIRPDGQIGLSNKQNSSRKTVPSSRILAWDSAERNILLYKAKAGQVDVMDSDSGELLTTLTHTPLIERGYLSWDGSALLINQDQVMLGQKQITHESTLTAAHFAPPIYQLRFGSSYVDSNRQIVLGYEDGTVNALHWADEWSFDPQNKPPIPLQVNNRHESAITTVQFSANGKYLMTGDSAGNIQMRSLGPNSVEGAREMRFQDDPVQEVRLSSKMDLAAISENGQTVLMDSKGNFVDINGIEDLPPAASIEFSSDGKLMAIGHHTAKLSVWKLGGKLDGIPIHLLHVDSIAGEQEITTRIVFDKTNSRVLAVTEEGTVGLIQIEANDDDRVLLGFSGDAPALSLDIWNNRAFVVFSDGSIASIGISNAKWNWQREFELKRKIMAARYVFDQPHYQAVTLSHEDLQRNSSTSFGSTTLGGRIQADIALSAKRIVTSASKLGSKLWQIDDNQNGISANTIARVAGIDPHFSPDGSVFVTSVGEDIRLWSSDSGQLLGKIEGTFEGFDIESNTVVSRVHESDGSETVAMQKHWSLADGSELTKPDATTLYETDTQDIWQIKKIEKIGGVTHHELQSYKGEALWVPKEGRFGASLPEISRSIFVDAEISLLPRSTELLRQDLKAATRACIDPFFRVESLGELQAHAWEAYETCERSYNRCPSVAMQTAFLGLTAEKANSANNRCYLDSH